jgi:hypothetical protein
MPRRLLIAGLDYGTSFTKVVLRDNNNYGQHAQAVTSPDFKDGLFPSLVGVRNGCLFFPPTPADAAEVLYLKMLAGDITAGETLESIMFRVARSDQDTRKRLENELVGLVSDTEGDAAFVRTLLAFYFARIMLAVEEFIRAESHWSDFDFSGVEHEDYLIYQLAVPSGLMSWELSAETLFREALIIAYRLRDMPILKGRDGTPFHHWNAMVTEQMKTQPDWKEEFQWQCLIYPETAGAVQAYFRSPNASEGLFITMDVGAGTVDMNAFRRQRNISDCSYYATIVSPLGVANLQKPVTKKAPSGEGQVVKELRQKLSDLFILAKHYQKNHGTMRGQRTWDLATFFILGGGAHLDIYSLNFANGLRNAGIYAFNGNDAPNVLRIPEASNLDLPRGTEFGRFAVAYGLSFFRPNLDRVKLPHELKKFDEVYPSEEDGRPPYGFNWDD